MAAPTLTNTEAFIEAFVHADYVALGRKLYPFCLRHWFLLAALKSPLTHGGEWTLEDIRLAVMVLSTRSNERFFDASRFKSLYWRLWKKFSTLFCDREHVARNRDIIYQFIEDHYPSFPFWVSGKAESPQRVPGFIVAAARMLGACTRDELLNMSLGEVIAWNLAKNENESVMEPNANLMSDDDVSILRRPEFREAA